ncbi:hypothetical protein GDI1465 [Gluconacetobacter diazotrophicus PA1 5]|uniref:Uncharacterized protein n=1 Tax=Gluconacetobacter diazotrophicus (strain ATCC 49037 / DSM 5601 / CCUG 37298 / CIP 103539 / LMG 7603 / PAl5) TaxID=272568 RepID=A9HFU1_GLUDA|nr:hypothetical protein GDI1465 [Gluconacetobacter diazotrophicus PA1 5]
MGVQAETRKSPRAGAGGPCFHMHDAGRRGHKSNPVSARPSLNPAPPRANVTIRSARGGVS